MDISPLAPQDYPELPLMSGVKLGVAEAGIKYKGRTDVLLMTFEKPVQIAGVFTKSFCPSAPVDWCKQMLANGKASAILVNSGNANAFTGVKGWEAVRASAEMVADALNVRTNEVYLASTGVIGEPLDATAFGSVVDKLVAQEVSASWLDAAKAIMTTDTFPKVAGKSVLVGEKSYQINGIAKGSGMIAPDMATMLSFVVTDFPLPASYLQKVLKKAVDRSFNAVTVDSDTSTSDTVLLCSIGSAAETKQPTDLEMRAFEKALLSVLTDLAHQIVRDGEGASKFVEINVLGAKSSRSAKKVAMSIANSPLVKTAIAGEDANWGRVVMAVGKAGEPADRDKLAIWFGDVRVAVEGERDPDYSEDDASAVMKNEEISISVDLGLGRGKATVWTCDLTKQYVAINGDYRS